MNPDTARVMTTYPTGDVEALRVGAKIADHILSEMVELPLYGGLFTLQDDDSLVAMARPTMTGLSIRVERKETK